MNQRTFCERWNMVVHEVIKGRDVDKQRNHCYRYDLEPFGVSHLSCHTPYVLIFFVVNFCCCYLGTDEGFLFALDS